MGKLTDKQEMFCKEYLIDLNATQAAIRAGYSKKTANEQAGRLLVNVSVQSKISELKESRSNRIEMSADGVLKELKNWVRGKGMKNIDRGAFIREKNRLKGKVK